jgi:hypothetical protein
MKAGACGIIFCRNRQLDRNPITVCECVERESQRQTEKERKKEKGKRGENESQRKNTGGEMSVENVQTKRKEHRV